MLLDVLRQNRTLQVLNIAENNNMITDGGTHFYEALKLNSSLTNCDYRMTMINSNNRSNNETIDPTVQKSIQDLLSTRAAEVRQQKRKMRDSYIVVQT